jgi:hypothetical protein
MARNPVLDASLGYLKTNFPGSRITAFNNGGDDDDKKKNGLGTTARGTVVPDTYQKLFRDNVVEFNPAMFLDGSQSPPPVDQVAPTSDFGGVEGAELRKLQEVPLTEKQQDFFGVLQKVQGSQTGESPSDVSIPAKPGAIAAPPGPSEAELELMQKGLLFNPSQRRISAAEDQQRILNQGVLDALEGQVGEPDFEAQTRAVAPRSFFDKIRGGISKIGEGLQREGVSEALGQFSRDIIATPDMGTALGPALSGAAAELELGEERIAGLEEQKRIDEMNQAELVMHHLQRGDSQSAMQALKFIEMMTEVPPEQDWELYTSTPVMKDGVSGFLAMDKNSSEVVFFTADAVNASGASGEAGKEKRLGETALEANKDLTLYDRDFAMAGVPVDRNASGELYQTSDASGLGTAFTEDGYKAMLGQFVSEATTGDEGFFKKTSKDLARFFIRGDPMGEKVQQGYVDAYNFINPIVRYLSGAQMTDAEARRYFTALIPKPGDAFNIVLNKRKKRELLARAMRGDESALGEVTPELFKKRGDRTGRFSSENDPTGARAANQILGELDELYGSTEDVGSEVAEDDETWEIS